jgi:hypothetical protein
LDLSFDIPVYDYGVASHETSTAKRARRERGKKRIGIDLGCSSL